MVPQPIRCLAGPLALGALLLLTLVLAAPAARAEGEDEGLDEISAKVKAQMEKIVELMRKNEQALLELSTGQRADPERVDVDVTPPEQPAGGSPSGEEAARSLEELIRDQRSTGNRIPGELEELVRMVPQ